MGLYAQADSARFDRSSLCLMMIAHPEQAFGKEIEIIFREMEMPERFNDHSLGVRVVKFPTEKGTETEKTILGFADQTQIAKKMIAKWFSRDKNSGVFSTDLLVDRGGYNATKREVESARRTSRGWTMLTDVGDRLISHTFLVMCEYSYDRSYSSQNNADEQPKSGMKSKAIDVNDAKAVDEYNNYLYQKDNRLKDFELKCTSYLFQLEWNDSVANEFYERFYTEEANPEKAYAFQQDKSTFKISYLGCCTDKESINNKDGKYTNQQLIKKVCIRLRDKNLATLQHAHPEFRIKSQISGVEPIQVDIGKKEDVTPDSKYEVLLPVFTKNATFEYKRIGIIQPISGKIWDNRYMIPEVDDFTAADVTYFKQLSGGEILPGMIVREMDK